MYSHISTDQAHEILMDKAKIVSAERIKIVAPSIFSEKPSITTSSKYHFIPTSSVLEIMQSQGWYPVHVAEQSVRSEEKMGYQRHIIRFRNFYKNFVFNGSAVEMVLVNSHDGTCAYQIHAGVFRLVCSNGMVVANSLFQTLRVRHQGNLNQDFIDVSHKVIQDIPQIVEEVQSFNQIELSREEQAAFAISALLLRWSQESPDDRPPIQPHQLLRTRRLEDQKSDLYTTFNVVQENLIRGGLLGYTQKRTVTRTREVKSISENVRLNKALWSLAQEMKNIKTVQMA